MGISSEKYNATSQNIGYNCGNDHLVQLSARIFCCYICLLLAPDRLLFFYNVYIRRVTFLLLLVCRKIAAHQEQQTRYGAQAARR